MGTEILSGRLWAVTFDTSSAHYDVEDLSEESQTRTHTRIENLRNKAMKLLLLFAGITLVNFIYQLFTAKDWGVALDRTFFQGVALLSAHFLG